MKTNKGLCEAQAVTAIENYVPRCMRNSKLMLNEEKTEFFIIGTERQLSKVSVDKIKIGHAEVTPFSLARNVGAWFDSYLNMSTFVTKTCGSSFYYLYNIRHITKYLSRESTERLFYAFITSGLDYRNIFFIWCSGVSYYERKRTIGLSRTQVLSYYPFNSETLLFTSANAY